MNGAAETSVAVGLFVVGAVLAASTVLSAVRTIVLPHGRSSRLTRVVFRTVRRALALHDLLPGSKARRDRVDALYAPLALVCLPILWLTAALVGFTLMFRALDAPWRTAFKQAGSALLTIGFADVDDMPRLVLTFVAAGFAISFLVLVLITYLPTMYQAYSNREIALTALETYAGEPADPVELLVRYRRVGAFEKLPELWKDWQQHFFELRETHTALPAVNLFRSSTTDRHWVPSVCALLDGAALWNAACREHEDPAASLCIRAGYLALADIAEFFQADVARTHEPDDPISVTRAEFDAFYARLQDAEVPLARSADEAWIRWRGWRVNYDESVGFLAELTSVPPEHRPGRR